MADQPRNLGHYLGRQTAKIKMEKDARAILRAQLEVELHNKRQCSYESYQCSHLCVDGSKYCVKHILNDKNAPFKQCNYIYQNNGKRCHLSAPKGDKKDYGYCSEHALKTTLSRNKQNAKNPPPLSAESLLTNLSHYVKKPRNRSASSSSYISDEERNHGDDISESKSIRTVDPFVDIDANAAYNERCNEVLDMCSESESDVEPSTYATVWHDANADSSDNESIDSEDEDPLKHANVYTAEEISLLTRDKLVRLQSLYIEEYKHLRYLLRERRRRYIHSLKREKETCCNIYNQVRDNPKEQRLYRKLKQYNKYHKAYGEEAILTKRLHDLRAKISEGGSVKPTSFSRCQFTEGGVKCGERPLPMAKHCRKHILEDPHQVLFKACGKVNADVECNTPVEAIFDDSTCKLHTDIPPIRSYNQPRTSQGSKCKGKESESDPDDSLDLPPHYAMPRSDSVKTEMIDYSLPSLPKMETLPSLLFEDSAESLSSTLQYSTSEFTESYAEQGSIDVPESNTTELNNIPSANEACTYDDEGFKTEEMNDDEHLESEIAIDESDLLNLNDDVPEEVEPTTEVDFQSEVELQATEEEGEVQESSEIQVAEESVNYYEKCVIDGNDDDLADNVLMDKSDNIMEEVDDTKTSELLEDDAEQTNNSPPVFDDARTEEVPTNCENMEVE